MNFSTSCTLTLGSKKGRKRKGEEPDVKSAKLRKVNILVNNIHVNVASYEIPHMDLIAKDFKNTRIWNEVKEMGISSQKELIDALEDKFGCVICQVRI